MNYGIVFHFILGYYLISEHDILSNMTNLKEEHPIHPEEYYLYIAVVTFIINLLTRLFWSKGGY